VKALPQNKVIATEKVGG